MKDTLVVVPVYNEEDVVEQVAIESLEHSGTFADLLFINDGSTDHSSSILNTISKKLQHISVIDKKKNEGYGASLISGIDYGIQNGYRYCITMDCDAQHQPVDLPRFRNFQEDIDLVSGSRYLPESGQKGISPPEDRMEINKRITKMINTYYKLSITDAFCGFKRYKLSSFRENGFTEKGYASPLELWSYLYHKNLSLSELAVDRIYITDDRSFGQDLDKKRKRYRYYLQIWRESHRKYGTIPIS